MKELGRGLRGGSIRAGCPYLQHSFWLALVGEGMDPRLEGHQNYTGLIPRVSQTPP